MYTYTMPTGDETENTIEITEKTSEGFFLNAPCCSSRLNLGMFSGYFKYTSSDIAEYTGENYDGNRYKITAQLKENKLHIQVTSEEEIAEDRLLEFGMNVRMSGIYELK